MRQICRRVQSETRAQKQKFLCSCSFDVYMDNFGYIFFNEDIRFNRNKKQLHRFLYLVNIVFYKFFPLLHQYRMVRRYIRLCLR